MKRWICTVAYDGTDFDGWQSQPSGNAIQDHIEQRLETLLKMPVGIHGSGRTDAGVHARNQVFHTDIDWQHGEDALKRALNTGIPYTIRILDCKSVATESGFHARFSATGKRYTYKICLGDPSPFEARFVTTIHPNRFSIEKVREASQCFLGEHDFAGFAARRESGTPVTNSIRKIQTIDWSEESGGHWTMSIRGNGFLYKMVRSIAGTLLQVGLGRMDSEDITHILNTGERTHTVNTAPPHGLCLDEVFYDDNT